MTFTEIADDDATEVYARYADVYDALFSELQDDLGFYLRLASAKSGPILELGAGTGRVTERLLRAGYPVTGIDVSAAMLAHAAVRLAPFAPRFTSICGDVRAMRLPDRFPLAVAPYGMVAHLLTDADRLATFRAVRDHLEPGGVFAFDDRPSWLGEQADGTRLEHNRSGFDPIAKLPVRLLSNSVDFAGSSVSMRYDFIDWLEGGRVARRKIVRITFRNIPLDEELALLAEAGLSDVKIFADFDETPFDREHLTANKRVVVTCRRAE
jgi:SAM-dependent methyltransferase